MRKNSGRHAVEEFKILHFVANKPCANLQLINIIMITSLYTFRNLYQTELFSFIKFVFSLLASKILFLNPSLAIVNYGVWFAYIIKCESRSERKFNIPQKIWHNVWCKKKWRYQKLIVKKQEILWYRIFVQNV